MHHSVEGKKTNEKIASHATRCLDEISLQAQHTYRVEDPVVHDGYTNVYAVSSLHGRFVARGDTMFMLLRRELNAIADLRERNLAGLTAEAATEEWIAPVKGLGRLASKSKAWTVVDMKRDLKRVSFVRRMR